ncbi:hypothetical protein [Rhodopirellula europaea]|uniref:hypothetical protein n=1 Tax=Rhodopirellula europaea TaxID=1263866 RepID=UPI003D27A74C|tara:strand:+ start:1044 stop:1262 length:219 start_codon:yes stop_codon:yes gene_type:complete
MENTAPVLASGNRDSTENHLMANPYEATTEELLKSAPGVPDFRIIAFLLAGFAAIVDCNCRPTEVHTTGTQD